MQRAYLTQEYPKAERPRIEDLETPRKVKRKAQNTIER